jgi:hypothetical protein
MTKDELYTAYFNERISSSIQQDFVRYIFQGYIQADKLIKNQELQPGPSKNLYPYVRWANIDNNILSLNKYEGLETSSNQNIVHNSYHTLVKCENIRITISAVNNPSSLPRTAIFRNKLASLQYQFVISKDKINFELKDIESIKNSIVYAFIVHGPDDNNPKYPGFIYVAFPNEKCTKYLDKINLIKKFPDLVESLYRDDMEKIPDNANVKLTVRETLL